MNAPEHRQAGRRLDPRLWLVAAFVVGALVGAAVAFLVPRGSDRAAGPGPSGQTPRERAAPPQAPTATVTATPSTRVATAQMTKPLDQLARGDRVVYNMHLCRFERFVTGVDVSLISCTGGSFQVRTVQLVPVEASTGD
ncbi:MAG: hypothetical protein ACTHOK_12370 [Nocardioidaceae bacterium]